MPDAVVSISENYRGQFRFQSDDPYFLNNFSDRNWFSPDGHVINQDQTLTILRDIAQMYHVRMTQDAVDRLKFLTDETPLTTPSFIPPEGFELRRFQIRSIRSMMDESRVMLNESCGTGKTATAIFNACWRLDKGLVDRVVVWCPVALIGDWIREIQRLSGLSASTPVRSWSADKRAEFFETDDAQVWVLNYERIRTADKTAIESALKRDGCRTMFIMDEVQKVKNRKSAVHREIAKLTRHVNTSSILALTATPIVRGPEDFYNEFRILDPEIFGRVCDFEHNFTFNDGEKDMFGSYLGYQNLTYMHLLTGAQVFTATKTQPEIAAEFPAKVEIPLHVELSTQERKLYREVHDFAHSIPIEEREFSLFMLTFRRICDMPEVLLRDFAFDDSNYGRQAQEVDRICKKYAPHLVDSKESAKLELVREKVDEIVGAGEKMIIFGALTNNCLFPLAKHLAKYEPLLYVGGMSPEQQDSVKQDFKTRSDKNLLLMSDAGQVGLNFQECATVMHYQLPYTNAAYEQRSDRVHRIDSKGDSITVYRIITEGTVEERIEETMCGRRQISSEMGFSGEYEEYGAISQEDAGYYCGFDD